jgi:hypothetical protein
MKLQTLIREATPSDINFILNSWLKSYRCHEDMTRMSNEDYYKYYKAHIVELLQKSGIKISCEQDDHNFIYGYICYDLLKDNLIIHYIYTRYSHRKLGIANGLISSLDKKELWCTSANRIFDELKAKYKIQYNPYIVRR